MKNNERWRKTRKSHFFSKKAKKRPQNKANEAKQGEFINNVSNYPKIVGALFKGK